MVQILVGDKIVSVVIQALHLWNRLCPKLGRQPPRLAEQVMASLIDKLGDNNSKVRDLAEQGILQADSLPVLGLLGGSVGKL